MSFIKISTTSCLPKTGGTRDCFYYYFSTILQIILWYYYYYYYYTTKGVSSGDVQKI